jgi:paraquat-inducible protein B
MSTKPNPTIIGFFIVTGLTLIVVAIALFSSYRWFAPRKTFLIYFADSVKGLDVGSAVTFKGVRIGRVKEVLIHFNQATTDLHSPVLIEVDIQTLESKIDRTVISDDPAQLQAEIRKGLRAQLALESYLTSRLYVELEVFPDAEAPVFHQLRPDYLEIPSQRARFSELLTTLSQIDVSGIANKLESLLTKLDRGLGDVQFKEINDSLVKALKRVDEVAGSADLQETMTSLRQTLREVQTLATNADARLEPLSQHAVRTLEEATRSLAEIRGAAEELRSTLAVRSPLRAELDTTLSDLGDAARSVSALAEFLRHNPQTLITGRKSSSTTK